MAKQQGGRAAAERGNIATDHAFVATPPSSPLVQAANEATAKWMRRRKRPARFAEGIGVMVDVDAWEYRRRRVRKATFESGRSRTQCCSLNVPDCREKSSGQKRLFAR